MHHVFDRTNDQKIAATVWVVSLALIVCDWFVEPNLASLGLWLTGLALTMTVRTYLCAAESREREVFEIGRQCADLYGRD